MAFQNLLFARMKTNSIAGIKKPQMKKKKKSNPIFTQRIKGDPYISDRVMTAFFSPHLRNSPNCSYIFQSSSAKNSPTIRSGNVTIDSISFDGNIPALWIRHWTAIFSGQRNRPQTPKSTLSQNIASRTDRQSSVLCRRSIVRKSSSVACSGSSSFGSRQCIRSASERPNACANGSRRFTSGSPTPVSLN